MTLFHDAHSLGLHTIPLLGKIGPKFLDQEIIFRTDGRHRRTFGGQGDLLFFTKLLIQKGFSPWACYFQTNENQLNL